jgi:hypothetical protein
MPSLSNTSTITTPPLLTLLLLLVAELSLSNTSTSTTPPLLTLHLLQVAELYQAQRAACESIPECAYVTPMAGYTGYTPIKLAPNLVGTTAQGYFMFLGDSTHGFCMARNSIPEGSDMVTPPSPLLRPLHTPPLFLPSTSLSPSLSPPPPSDCKMNAMAALHSKLAAVA